MEYSLCCSHNGFGASYFNMLDTLGLALKDNGLSLSQKPPTLPRKIKIQLHHFPGLLFFVPNICIQPAESLQCCLHVHTFRPDLFILDNQLELLPGRRQFLPVPTLSSL